MNKRVPVIIGILLILVLLVVLLSLALSPAPEAPETQPSLQETQPPENGDQSQTPQTETGPTLPSLNKLTEPPALTADKAFVYDCATGEYLYLLGTPEDWVYPASTTKLFCGWVAMQYLEPDQMLTVGPEITFIEELSSVAGLNIGDRLTAKDMVSCMLLPSGCDAAYVLAASAGRVIAGDPDLGAREAVDVFVAEMNNKAQQLGMKNTHFVTPDGYHRSDHYISLGSYVIIGKLCLEDPTISQAACQFRTTVYLEDGTPKTLENLNEPLNPNSAYYRADCRGLKTGRTSAAGSCILAAYWTGDRYLLIGVFGCPERDDRYMDANRLYDAVMAIN